VERRGPVTASTPEHARGYENWPGRVGRTVAETDRAYPRERRAREGSPNIVVILVDDMGYSDIGPFGGEIPTPHLDRLSAAGTRFANYHTAPLCSPARAAMLTGLNPHRAGYGGVANSDPGLPALRLELADDVLTLPEILRSAGYATYAIGKWHLTRDALMHDAADKSSWPLQRGFDRYYGSLEGCNSFFHPNRLVRDNSTVDVEEYPPGYYLTDDLTDQALAMLRGLRANDATKPFFLYFAHVAMHGPLAAPAGDIAAHRGRYDVGWDAIREERFARQRASGLFPPATELGPRNGEAGFDVPAWDSLAAEQRELYARHMEVYAAMVSTVDRSLGRLCDELEALGELDNTIIVFTSDNGATKEGGAEGTRSYFSRFVHVAGLPPDWEPDVSRDLDLLGGPRTMIHYPRGWGMVSNTPFRLYKGQTYAGGVRVPFLMSWPDGLPRGADDPGTRDQYQYVTDVLPTLLELAGVEAPKERQGKAAQEPDGVSFAPVLASATAASTHPEQYAECGGNRGFYRRGWKLVTLHAPGTPFDDAEWRLYDVRADPNELSDVAAEHPDKVRELADAWERAAWTNTVFPLADPRTMPVGRRPAEAQLEGSVVLRPGTPTLERHRSAQLVGLRSFGIDIAFSHEAGAEGVLVAHGDQGGGYQLRVEAGRLHLDYNEYGALHEVDLGALVAGRRALEVRVSWLPGFRWRWEVAVDGESRGGLAQVWMLLGLAPFTGIDVGRCAGGPVSWSVHERHGAFRYAGRDLRVSYRPGERADYDPVHVAGALAEVSRYYD
jgi:arylsulfatase A-like enzyme